MLFDAANCTLHAGLHTMIVCYHQLEHYIVVSAAFFDFIRLEFFSTVYSQIANLSASEVTNCFRSAGGDARVLVGKDTRYSVPLSMTNRKIPIKIGKTA